jgi:hypothetical protein
MVMEMENKLLVIYVGVGGINVEEISDYMQNVAAKIMPKTFDGEIIFIPISGFDSRIECINPKYITEQELIDKNNKLLSELNEELKHQLDILNNKK